MPGADRAFVTFRYAADADQARWVWRSRRARLNEMIAEFRFWEVWRGTWCHPSVDGLPNLRVRRPPEVPDLIWKNLPAQGIVHSYVRPMIIWCLVCAMLLPAGLVVLSLTKVKLHLRNGTNEGAGAAEVAVVLKRLEALLAFVGFADVEVADALLVTVVIAVINLSLKQVIDAAIRVIERPAAVSR